MYEAMKTGRRRGIFAAMAALSLTAAAQVLAPAGENPMMYADTVRAGVPYAKDPHVIRLDGRYLMYYSEPPRPQVEGDGWAIAIAESRDLTDWKRVGEILPGAAYESKGLCAPCALVRNDTVHIFYQTYGNGPKDAICHAWSVDGLHFTRDASNPIFSPEGDWNNGRAIDAEVALWNGEYYLYFASRTPDGVKQIPGVAKAPGDTDFSRDSWTQACDASILYPQLPWEGECIEAPSVIGRGRWLYMFYAGAYNNRPQQVGIARSADGVTWERLSDVPFLPVGKAGEWNSSESGHPHIFNDPSTGRTWLFYQGNDTHGRTWLLTKREVVWP